MSQYDKVGDGRYLAGRAMDRGARVLEELETILRDVVNEAEQQGSQES